MNKKINDMFFMRPWAVKESVLKAMAEIIDRHMKGEKLSQDEISAKIGGEKTNPPTYEVINGMAHIPIYGVISKRASLIHKVSIGAGTAVQDIRKNLNAAMNDPAVEKIIFEIDSPGGSADGVAEISDYIHGLRGKKPMIAYANGQMDSAAYWIGSSADKIYASVGAEVGSIGVYTTIYDYTVANHNDGIQSTIIKAGRYKAAGHPDKNFTEDDKAAIQEEVNSFYNLFMDAVKRNRGMNAEQVEKVANGKVYIGQEALKMGLVDGLEDFDTFIDSIQACNDDERRRKRNTENPLNVKCQGCGHEFVYVKEPESAMGAVKCPSCQHQIDQTGAVLDGEPKTKKEGDMEVKDITLEMLKKERPEIVETIAKDAKAEGHKEGTAEGVTTERARCSGIIEKSKPYKDVVDNDMIKTAVDKGTDPVVAESEFKDKKLAALQGSAPKSPGPGEDPTKSVKTHLEIAKEYAALNKCSMTDALAATAPVRKK